MTDVSIRTIRAMLQGRASELAALLAPGGYERGGLYEAPNPTRGDRKAGSFKIYTRGAAAGKWVDYAGVNAPFVSGGDRGDIIDLIAYCRCERDRKQAIRWARDFLGLSAMSQGEKDRLTALALAKKKQAVARERDEQERRMQRACDLWMRAKPGLAGTAAERYLAFRGIDLAAIPSLVVNDIRFLPALEFTQGAQWEMQGERRVKTAPGPELPAIVSCLRNRHGAVTGVHLTYLADGARGPRDRAYAKIMHGQVVDAVIRIAHGRDGLSPEDVREQGHLAELAPTLVCEGLEDGLSLAMALPDARVWAATSLGNLGNVYLDHPCVGDVTVARDNDWQSPQAVRQFERAIEALEVHGKPISVMSAIAGKDFNDLLRM
jgi:hypothetical protein